MGLNSSVEVDLKPVPRRQVTFTVSKENAQQIVGYIDHLIATQDPQRQRTPFLSNDMHMVLNGFRAIAEDKDFPGY